jgi:hypothetical protein
VSRVGVTVEGGLLAADLVERIALGDETVAGQKPKDFGLEAGRPSAEIQAAFSAARVYWEGFKLRRETPGVSAVTVTREAWIYPLLERLGYALTFQRAAAQVGGQGYAISHRVGEGETGTPVHSVAFNQKLDERGELKRSPHALLRIPEQQRRAVEDRDQWTRTAAIAEQRTIVAPELHRNRP